MLVSHVIFTMCFYLKSFMLYVTGEVLEHHGMSLNEQHPAGFILCHSMWSMHVALATGFVSQGSYTDR